MRNFHDLPAFIDGMFNDMRDVLFETASRVKDRMSVEGKRRTPGEKVDWDSLKQQRFVMAKLRREGIPYRRTDRYRLGWQLQRVAFGTNLSNRHTAAGAIGGLPSGWQSRIHRGRWPHLITVLFEELAKVPAEISSRLKVLAGKQ